MVVMCVFESVLVLVPSYTESERVQPIYLLNSIRTRAIHRHPALNLR